MAIPPPEVVLSSNTLITERAGELGWVSPRAARRAIATARRVAGRGEHGDALAILRERCGLSDAVLDAIRRDEEAPPPPRWKFWAPRRGLFGTWNAPLAKLFEAVRGLPKPGYVSTDCAQQDRAQAELRRRLAAGPDTVCEALARHDTPSRVSPDPLPTLLATWIRHGLAEPPTTWSGRSTGERARGSSGGTC